MSTLGTIKATMWSPSALTFRLTFGSAMRLLFAASRTSASSSSTSAVGVSGGSFRPTTTSPYAFAFAMTDGCVMPRSLARLPSARRSDWIQRFTVAMVAWRAR